MSRGNIYMTFWRCFISNYIYQILKNFLSFWQAIGIKICFVDYLIILIFLIILGTLNLNMEKGDYCKNKWKEQRNRSYRVCTHAQSNPYTRIHVCVCVWVDIEYVQQITINNCRCAPPLYTFQLLPFSG